MFVCKKCDEEYDESMRYSRDSRYCKKCGEERTQYQKYMELSISDKCCDKLKKEPLRRKAKELGMKCVILGILASESYQREKAWLEYGCNVFYQFKDNQCKPLSFWTDDDINEYIEKYNIKDVVVGSIFTNYISKETVHFSNKNELFYTKNSDEDMIISELSKITNVYKRSSEVMYKYNVSNHIEKVKNEVAKLLEGDNSGHGLEHINRVLDLSLKFAEKENANKYIVSLIALLHDADDYKLFGMENAEKLTNAKIIMDDCNVDKAIQEQVCDAINNIGYSKRLKGHSPTTLEGKIVSDVDMCDALGANGILRVYTYSMKNGKPFFDRNIFPIEDMNAEKYTRKCADSSVCHIFEKILKLKDLMLTDSGKEESKNRHQIVVDFLYHLFNEENAPEWIEYLNNYLK